MYGYDHPMASTLLSVIVDLACLVFLFCVHDFHTEDSDRLPSHRPSVTMETPSSTSSSSVRDFSTKLIFFSHEFPPDDLQDLFRRLQRFSKDRRFRLLSLFLDESTLVVQEEARRLPQHLRDLLPPFQTVLSLVDSGDFRKGPLGGALESAMLVVLELGMFIGHYEATNFPYDLPRSTATLAGLSIGLLSAAAVSGSSSLAELAMTGAESVRIAFRLGVHVDSVSQSLESREPDGSMSDSWAYVVTGISAQEVQKELDQFNTETANPELTKVFISAADKNSVSVTGPPSRLKAAFRHSQVLRYSKHLPLPVYNGLCHAPHLYTDVDIDIITNGSEARCDRDRRIQLPLLSPQTGKRYPAPTVDTLYQQICSEILTGTIYLDYLTAGIINSISNSLSPECQVMLFRSSIVSQGIISSMESELSQLIFSRKDLLDWAFHEDETRLPRTPKQSKLAVIGMSCRMPGGADNNELFWKILEEGRDVHATVPPDRFDLHTHYDPTGKTDNATETPYGNFINNPGFFDASFFNMSPLEAEQTDPMHRLALVTAYEALEMAGYAPNRTPSTNLKRIGTFYGQASDDWREVNGGQNIGTYAVPGGERAFANGRINYFFKFSGPSFNIDTACSSGLAAVNAACSALWNGEADMVIAGGLSVITNPDNYCMLCKGHFLSKTGQCKVWDKDADGYCRADGIGSVVIKRLEDAEADNDNIIATIVAGATNHSAEAVSITRPHAGAQKENYMQVMQMAGVNPLDVSFIELHGTGTQAGDAIESESVADVFAPAHVRRRERLLLGAVKSNIGHGEAAAGIASLLKVLLVYQKNQIPPHVGIKSELNPLIVKLLEGRNAGLALENTPWPRQPGKKRYSLVNSFGAHGGNTTLLLEDAPEKRRIGQDTRGTYPFTVSAKSKASLKGNIEALIEYLQQNPDVNLCDLSYTLCARRIHHNLRVATSAWSVSQLQKFLESSLEGTSNARAVPPPPPVTFTFTGQGSFYEGIGRQLFMDFPFYRDQVLKLDHLVQQFKFPSVVPAIEGTLVADEASPLVTQLTIVVTEIALTRLWGLLGVQPNAVIGHSLGEYAALVAAGVISAADAIYLVGKRAELTLATCQTGSHAMLAVRASVEKIKEIDSSGAYEISCINGPNDTVISGPSNDLENIRSKLEHSGLKCTPLDVPFAFHTAQMIPMLQPLEQAAKHVTFKTPTIPIISPLLSNCVFDGKTINAKYLCRASREPVNFVGALEAAEDMGIVDDKTVWLEIGPHPVCTSFVRNCFAGAKLVSSLSRKEDNYATLSSSLAKLHVLGSAVNWNEYFRPWEKSLQLLTLPTYKWNEKNYWIPYVGTWTLDKAKPQKSNGVSAFGSGGSSLRTSSIHQIISEEVSESTAQLVAVSDIMHPDLLAAVHGHSMNGYGVATTTIWGDMALTVGEYLYKRLYPKTKEVKMNVANMEVLHAQVAKLDTSSSQLLQVEASLDMDTQSMMIYWYNIDDDGARTEEAYASATVTFEDSAAWQTEWNRVAHLVEGRIESLQRMAAEGTANKLNKNMAYTLFKNVVDYTDKYRGMQTVTLNDFEAYADITLVKETHGTWHTPPHWMDPAFHLAGFILNGSDASNTKDYFYVTPGWDSLRMAKPLAAGERYRSYVKMFPTGEDNMFAGDIYLLQGSTIVGMMSQIKFRRVPRLLMDHFFSAPDAGKASTKDTRPKDTRSKDTKAAAVPQKKSPPKPAPVPAATPKAKAEMSQPKSKVETPAMAPIEMEPPAVMPEPSKPAAAAPAEPATEDSGLFADCLEIIARESGLEKEELTDDATFVELGVDSLMSLVLAEKFKNELHIEVQSSIFIECSTLGELKKWLEENC